MLPILLSLALLVSGALVAENPYDVENGLTPSTIAGYAKKAGFPTEVIPEAVRIVLLESKGQPEKLQNDKGPGVGLFQIDLSVHWDSKGEENPMRKWFAQRGVNSREDAVEWLKDPLNNAETAFRIWEDRRRRQDSPTGWEAWSAYNGGNKPENRQQEDWDLATKAMDDYVASLNVSEEVDMEEEKVEVEDTVTEVVEPEKPSADVMNVPNTYIPRQPEMSKEPMSPRKQQINDIFVKLFASLGRM
jgi:hypothetical protein